MNVIEESVNAYKIIMSTLSKNLIFQITAPFEVDTERKTKSMLTLNLEEKNWK